MKKKPNLLLRAIWISIVIGVARSLLDVYRSGNITGLTSPEGAGYFAGTAMVSVFFVFIPVALVLLIWQVIIDSFAKKKRSS